MNTATPLGARGRSVIGGVEANVLLHINESRVDIVHTAVGPWGLLLVIHLVAVLDVVAQHLYHRRDAFTLRLR